MDENPQKSEELEDARLDPLRALVDLKNRNIHTSRIKDLNDFALRAEENGFLKVGLDARANALGILARLYGYEVSYIISKAGKPKQVMQATRHVPKRLRYDILKAANGRCALCGQSGADAELHVDHIKPVSKYPELVNDINNLQCLCADCNLGKSDRDDTDWRQHG